MPETNLDRDTRIENAGFSANGVYVVRDVDGRPLSWTFNGTLAGKTFGGGTIVLEGTTLSAGDCGLTDAQWRADTANGIWAAVSIGGTPYSLSASGSGWLDAPLRHLRFRLTGATAPSILGRVLVG